MKKIIKITGVFTMAIVIFSCNPSVQNDSAQLDTDELKKIIDKKNAKICEFYRKGWTDSVASFFTADFIQMIPNQKPTKGIDEFIASWKQSMRFGTWNFTFNATEVKGEKKMAVELGEYTLEFTPNENSPIPPISDKGHYVVLWKKMDGDWKGVWSAPVSEVPLPNPTLT